MGSSCGIVQPNFGDAGSSFDHFIVLIWLPQKLQSLGNDHIGETTPQTFSFRDNVANITGPVLTALWSVNLC